MSENLKYIREENHRIGRLNYRRADYKAMKLYFTKVDWRDFDVANTIDKKWDLFLKIYNDCVSQHVPRVSKKEITESDWFNKGCMEAKNKRDWMWNKWRRKRRADLWENYTNARNEHVRLCREVKRNYEKDIVEKCKDQPKLFYRFVNSKLKHKEGLNKLVVDEMNT